MTMERWQYPLPGVDVNNHFDRQTHSGIDQPAKSGTPLYAPTGGVVTAVGKGYVMGYDYGNWVEFRGNDGTFGFEAHMRLRSPLSVGDRITIGTTKVGEVGKTGKVTGSHVHLTLMTKSLTMSTRFDPEPYINARLTVGPEAKGDGMAVLFIQQVADAATKTKADPDGYKLWAIAGNSPGTSMNWDQYNTKSADALKAAITQFGDPIALSAGTWESRKKGYLEPVKTTASATIELPGSLTVDLSPASSEALVKVILDRLAARLSV